MKNPTHTSCLTDTNLDESWWPRCDPSVQPLQIIHDSQIPERIPELNPVGDEGWLTSLCVHHRSPGGFWVSVAPGARGWPSARSAPQLPASFASWRWRWSWRCCCPWRKSVRAGVAAGAFSRWQEKQGSSWSCQGAASPSCSHWAGLPRSCCPRDAAGGNSSLQGCVGTSWARARPSSAVTSPGGCLCLLTVQAGSLSPLKSRWRNMPNFVGYIFFLSCGKRIKDIYVRYILWDWDKKTPLGLLAGTLINKRRKDWWLSSSPLTMMWWLYFYSEYYVF